MEVVSHPYVVMVDLNEHKVSGKEQSFSGMISTDVYTQHRFTRLLIGVR